MPANHVLSACGVLIMEDTVLLVQANYGVFKGCWMLPGGLVEEGESLEEAVVREFLEETGQLAQPGRLIGLRNGTKLPKPKHDQQGPSAPAAGSITETAIHFAFEMRNPTGTLQAKDANEIAAVAYFPLQEALSHPDVIELSKAFLAAALRSSGGLFKNQAPIAVKNVYRTYDVYTCETPL